MFDDFSLLPWTLHHLYCHVKSFRLDHHPGKELFQTSVGCSICVVCSISADLRWLRNERERIAEVRIARQTVCQRLVIITRCRRVSMEGVKRIKVRLCREVTKQEKVKTALFYPGGVLKQSARSFGCFSGSRLSGL